MRYSKLLWQNIRLPAWQPEKLYALFLAHVDGEPTPQQRNEYAQQLMIFISAALARRKWFNTLRRRRLDPEDVSADILMHLIKRTPSIRLEYPCVPVLLKILNVAIFRRLISEVRQNRYVPDPLPDWCDEEGRGVTVAHCPAPSLVGSLQDALRDAEPDLCRGRWADQISICVLYRYLCRQIFRQNTILPWSHLPARLKRRVSLEDHATIAYGLSKFIHDFAGAHE